MTSVGLRPPFAIASLLVCLMSPSGAPAQELFYADPGGAESLAHGGTALVWSTDDCIAGPFEVCKIRTAWANEDSPPGYIRTPFSNSGGPSGSNLASNLAQSGSFVYWLNQAGDVSRVHRGYGASTIEVVSSMEAPGPQSEIAVDSQYVYWLENDVATQTGKLFRAPVDGGTRELVVTSPDDVAHDLQVDGAGHVYFLADIQFFLCCVDPLHQIESDGAGGFNVVISAKSYIDGYTVDGADVVVASRVSPGSPLILSIAPVTGIANTGNWVDLYTAGSTGPPTIRNLTLSDTDVFWHEQRPTVGSSLLRLPRAGGSASATTLPLADAKDMLVDGDYRQMYVYWVNGGDIFRSPTNAGALTRDLDADDITLEVTQSIQDAAHSIPLVEDKATYVRAFARLASSSDGATQLNLFPGVTLEGTRSGIPLPGSPLRPISRTQPILDTVLDRASTENQFVFELPESWANGTVALTAIVDPRDVIFETDESNNQTSRTVTFTATDGVCIDIIPILTTLGVESGGSRSDKARTFARARSLMPIKKLGWIFRGGSPKSKPWTGDPYNFFESDDVNELLFHWWHDFLFAGAPGNCGSWRTIRAAVVGGAARFGISSGSAAIIYYLQAMTGGMPENQPRGGTSGLAHELGHQLGQGHIGCPVSGTGAPGSPDGSYPYAPCSLDSSNDHIGYDGLTGTLIVPFDASLTTPQYNDYMSYQADYWTSGYVYRKHFAELVSGTPSPPVSGAGGSLLLAGFQTDTGLVSLAHGYHLDPAAALIAAQGIADSTLPSTDLFVQVFDQSGLLQVNEPLQVFAVTEEFAGDPTYTSFFALVENQPDYLKVVIVDGSNKPLATATYGAGPPSVVITKPAAGTTLGDTVVVEWSGGDPDPGDVLEYRLLYSNDGGLTHHDLLTTRNLVANVDMTKMTTGASVEFRVLVSDGLHSSEDSVGPFAIPNRVPEVAILAGDFRELSAPVAYPFGKENVLRGYGSDSDDGQLSGASLSWNFTGPVAVAASGDTFRLQGLPPGVYIAALTATDSLGASSVAQLQVSILPKHMPSSTDTVGAVAVDGHCEDDAYEADGQRLVFRYEGGEIAEIAITRVGEYVHFCFGGLPGNAGSEYVELRIDDDASGDLFMQPSDRFIRIHRDGTAESGVGDGAGKDSIKNAALDVRAVTADVAGNTWQAEIRLHESLVGPVTGPIVRIGVLHSFNQNESVKWPKLFGATSPQSWGEVTPVPEPTAQAMIIAGLAALTILNVKRRGFSWKRTLADAGRSLVGSLDATGRQR